MNSRINNEATQT